MPSVTLTLAVWHGVANAVEGGQTDVFGRLRRFCGVVFIAHFPIFLAVLREAVDFADTIDRGFASKVTQQLRVEV